MKKKFIQTFRGCPRKKKTFRGSPKKKIRSRKSSPCPHPWLMVDPLTQNFSGFHFRLKSISHTLPVIRIGQTEKNTKIKRLTIEGKLSGWSCWTEERGSLSNFKFNLLERHVPFSFLPHVPLCPHFPKSWTVPNSLWIAVIRLYCIEYKYM